MGIMRVYFFDAETARELSDHPLNGKSWLGTSGYVHQDGDFVPGTCTSLAVCDHSSLSHVANERHVTSADFDRPVRVKIWGPKTVDWRLLCPSDRPLSEDELQQATHLTLASK